MANFMLFKYGSYYIDLKFMHNKFEFEYWVLD